MPNWQYSTKIATTLYYSIVVLRTITEQPDGSVLLTTIDLGELVLLALELAILVQGKMYPPLRCRIEDNRIELYQTRSESYAAFAGAKIRWGEDLAPPFKRMNSRREFQERSGVPFALSLFARRSRSHEKLVTDPETDPGAFAIRSKQGGHR